MKLSTSKLFANSLNYRYEYEENTCYLSSLLSVHNTKQNYTLLFFAFLTLLFINLNRFWITYTDLSTYYTYRQKSAHTMNYAVNSLIMPLDQYAMFIFKTSHSINFIYFSTFNLYNKFYFPIYAIFWDKICAIFLY